MSSQIPASGERDFRFTPLLNPIRDLAKNWDVDLATQLEDYLSELSDIHITFDGGKTTMNFAEAALLIQGSACVYSKKIDFLYNLVVQLLELLRSKKKLQKARENQDENQQDVEPDEEEFLSQDGIAADKNTNMKPGESSSVGRNLLPSVPPSLIPLDSDERGNFHLYNVKGDVLGNKRDYKVNAWDVNLKTGALLQDSAILEAGWNITLHSETINENNETMRDCENRTISDDDFAGGGDMIDDPFDAATPVPVKTSPSLKVPKISESPKKYSLRKRDKDLVSATEKALKLWTKLDPHEELPGAKAIRKGKTYTVLKSESSKRHEKPIEPINMFIRKQLYSPHYKLPKELENIPLFESLKPAICKEYNRRKVMLQKELSVDEEKEGESPERLKFEDIFDDDHNAGNDPDFEDDDNEDFPPILEPTRRSFLDHLDDKPGYEDSCCPLGSNESYVNLIKQYANEFMVEAKQAKTMTESAQRISSWEEKLSTQLQAEEQHVPYDMYVYCTKIIEKFSPQPSKQTVDFSKIVGGESTFEVSRYFLATLQLANNYNIDISSNNDAGGIQDIKKVELTLLSRRQHYEDIDDFNAS